VAQTAEYVPVAQLTTICNAIIPRILKTKRILCYDRTPCRRLFDLLCKEALLFV